jgi:hypothetical protein
VTDKPVVRQEKNMNDVMTTCSILNPFCPAAKGARLPDGNADKTMPFQERYLVTVTTDATYGYAAFVFCPNNNYTNWYQATAFNASKQITTWGAIQQGSTLQSNTWGTYANRTRIVSAGIKWIPTIAATAAGGPMIISQLNEPQALVGTSGGATNILPAVGLGVATKAQDFRDPVTCISVPADDSATLFNTPTAGISSAPGNSSNSYSGYFFSFTGPTNTVLGTFEYVINYEVEIVFSGSGNILGQMVTTSPDNPVAIAARKSIVKGMDTIMKGGEAIVDATVQTFAQQAVNAAGRLAYYGLKRYGPTALTGGIIPPGLLM